MKLWKKWIFGYINQGHFVNFVIMHLEEVLDLKSLKWWNDNGRKQIEYMRLKSVYYVAYFTTLQLFAFR